MSSNDSEESQRMFALQVMCQSVPTRIVLCSSASKRTVVSVQEANSSFDHCSEWGGEKYNGVCGKDVTALGMVEVRRLKCIRVVVKRSCRGCCVDFRRCGGDSGEGCSIVVSMVSV